MATTKDVRALAAQALARVTGGGEAFDPAPSEIEGLSDRDRAFFRQLCFGTLRYYHRLQGLLEPLLKKPLAKKEEAVRALLLLGLYQILYLRTPDHAAINATVNAAKILKKPWASGLVNGVLRSFLRRQNELLAVLERDEEGAVANSHPDWLLQKIQRDWPQHWRQIVAYNNAPPSMSLRVDLSRVNRADYRKQLEAAGISAQPDEHSASGLRLERAVDVSALPRFDEGWASVQDLGAQQAASLLALRPGLRLLDACAAPGGKALHLLENSEDCELTAIDISSERLLQVEENLRRCGREAHLIQADCSTEPSWWDERPFDRILLDAPCSGSGVIGHHPDIKLLRRATDIGQFAAQQYRLLQRLWPLLADGGQLLYCSCSIMAEENQRLIERFLASTTTAQALPIAASWGQPCGAGRQLLPNEGVNDGFFYALLSKPGNDAAS